MLERHLRNAPGDFYVEHGCCLSCGVWETEAVGLMQWDDDEYPQCFVARQPDTPDEIKRMIRAMSVQELDCIRYCGADPEIANKLIAAGEAGSCDRQDIVERLREQERPSLARRLLNALRGR